MTAQTNPKQGAKPSHNHAVTLTVPFMPTIGLDNITVPPKPSDFPLTREYGDMIYELCEVEGTRWVWVEDEKAWFDLGWNAKYQVTDMVQHESGSTTGLSNPPQKSDSIKENQDG